MNTGDITTDKIRDMFIPPYDYGLTVLETAGQITAATWKTISKCFACFTNNNESTTKCDSRAWFDCEQVSE